jgi:quinol monooxygenase YgiN
VIIVTGSVVVRDGAVDEAIRISLDHVHRSRTEPGCIQHGVYRDVENQRRLFFYEEWADRAALDAHFAVPASSMFVNALSALAVEPPSINIVE